MASPSTVYEPRTPSQGVLYQVVRDHFETFRGLAAGLRDGEGLPRFVEQAAFARSAPASRAEALAEAGIPRVPALRMAGRFRLIALIDEAAVIARILRHLHLPPEVPTPRPGRAPPLFAPGDIAGDNQPCALAGRDLGTTSGRF